jgi:tetratricopeptide (TPR) repeat protein
MKRADVELPGRWETEFTIAVTWGLVGNGKRMAQLLVRAMERNKKCYLYNPIEHDMAMLYDYLGASLHQIGKHDEAKSAWKYALEIELAKEESKQNKSRVAILSRMSV